MKRFSKENFQTLSLSIFKSIWCDCIFLSNVRPTNLTLLYSTVERRRNVFFWIHLFQQRLRPVDHPVKPCLFPPFLLTVDRRTRAHDSTLFSTK